MNKILFIMIVLSIIGLLCAKVKTTTAIYIDTIYPLDTMVHFNHDFNRVNLIYTDSLHKIMSNGPINLYLTGPKQ